MKIVTTTTLAQPSERYRRPSHPKKSQSNPPAHSGKRTGFMMATWSARKLSGPRTMSRLPMRMLCRSCRKGKPCCSCHTKLGSAMAAATSIPNHNQPLLRKRRSGPIRTPTSTPNTRKAMEYLVSSPTPASTPNQNQYRGSPRLIARTTHHTPQAAHPEKRLKGVHGQPVVHDQIDRDRDHGQCGQRLGKAAPTHLARQLSRHPDEPPSRDGRQQAQPQERIAERVPGEPGDEYVHRRMVNVTPSDVLRACHVIHLVAEDTVTCRSEQMEQKLRERQVKNNCRAGCEAAMRFRRFRPGKRNSRNHWSPLCPADDKICPERIHSSEDGRLFQNGWTSPAAWTLPPILSTRG